MAARSAFYPAPDVAVALARLLGVGEGGSVLELCAGTGGMLLSATLVMRERGLDPACNLWVANDLDPFAAGCCAVNTHLWGLPHVLIGCGDVFADNWCPVSVDLTHTRSSDLGCVRFIETLSRRAVSFIVT